MNRCSSRARFLVVVASLSVIACDPILGVRGVVRSAPTPACNGDSTKTEVALTPPVVDADVELRCGGQVVLQTKSDGDGRFSTATAGGGGGGCKVHVAKAGYKPREVPLVCRSEDGTPESGIACDGRVYIELERE